mmetsp:Transcript_55319/g.121314  ORF Transcript_55319/g.121314 Transcript_55319/m.121314 type:complete len:471 (+) Transcript_55319:63-1475(+)
MLRVSSLAIFVGCLILGHLAQAVQIGDRQVHYGTRLEKTIGGLGPSMYQRFAEDLSIKIPPSMMSPCVGGDDEDPAQNFAADPSQDLTATFQKCKLSEVNACPISGITSPVSLIYPGGKTSCLHGEFAFSVSPGDTDKLLFYFAGGGACWDQFSYDLGMCVQDLNGVLSMDPLVPDGSGFGIFNRSDVLNPFRSYTIVQVPYCTGDAFIGNTERDTWLHEGKPVAQVGYQNANAALKWALDNVDSTLSSLVIAGTSGGSLGAQAWAYHMLSTFKYEQAAVIGDSYVGLFPPGVQGPQIYEYAACDLPIFPHEIRELCFKQNVTVHDMFSFAMKSFGQVKFGQVQSKQDSVQVTFYRAVAVSKKLMSAAFASDADFYYQENRIFERYNKEPNYVEYLVDGSQHGFLPCPRFYTTDIANDDTAMLYQWVKNLGTPGGADVSTECSGDWLPADESNGVAYCDELLRNKTILSN